jgi:hypothetical protein
MPNAVAAFTTRKEWVHNFDEFIGHASSKTMVQLLGKLKKLGMHFE